MKKKSFFHVRQYLIWELLYICINQMQTRYYESIFITSIRVHKCMARFHPCTISVTSTSIEWIRSSNLTKRDLSLPTRRKHSESKRTFAAFFRYMGKIQFVRLLILWENCHCEGRSPVAFRSQNLTVLDALRLKW